MTKLCAVITDESDIAKAVILGAEAFEFRLDMFSKIPDDISFVKQKGMTIVTCRSKEDVSRKELFEKALNSGADFVDIESDSKLRDSFPSRTICSYHDFEKTPNSSEIISIFDDLSKSGVPKAAFMVRGLADLKNISDASEVLKKSGRRYILLGMGEVGEVTRIRAEKLGSFVSYCSVSKTSAEGQLTLTQAQSLKNAIITGITGYPLSKTFSPAIHNAAFCASDINGRYVKLPASKDELCLLPEIMKAYDISGINVTIPHKQAVMPLLTSFDSSAEKIGAVNTVDKNLRGYNTDHLGIAAALDFAEPENKKVLLIGAGGAARAAAYYFEKSNAELFITNRTYEKAAALAKEFGANAVRIEDLQPEYSIILNASPVCLAKNIFTENCVVMDMVYPDSDFLKSARDAGVKTVLSGKTMLIAQAAESFKIWTKTVPDKNEMEKAFDGAEK